MKIAHVIPFFAPAWSYGGPVKVCLDLSRELVIRHNQVTVLTTDTYDHLRRIDKVCEEMNGVKVLRFKNISNRLAKRSNLYLPVSFKKYFKQNVERYDIVHLHAFYTYQNIIASKYCVKYNIPYVLHLHEKFDATREMGKSAIKKVFLRLWGKSILKKAKKILVLSQNEKANLLKFDETLRDKIEIIPNPAPNYLGKCQNKSALRKKYNLSPNDRVILSLSRLTKLKGIDLLINAFALLVKKNNKFKLIIAGPNEGGYIRELEQIVKSHKIEKNVIFTGEADQKTKNELFCISDIFALFSRYESFGLTTLESLAHGLPVCLSKNVGLSQEVHNKKCGLIVTDPCNQKRTALELKRAVFSRVEFAVNCRGIVDEFSIDKIIDRVISIYKEIIK
jgi:glycosyltransferase involved in cell wall biosynthesis